MTRRRKIIIAAAAFAGLLVLGVVLVHAPAVQRPVFKRVTEAIERETGVSVALGDAFVRLWPGRLVAEDVSVAISGTVVATVERVEARWSWFGMIGVPRRIDVVEIDNVDLDLTEIPELPERATDEEEQTTDPWRVVEIGRLEVRGDGGAGALLDVTAVLDGLAVQASLEDGAARIDAEAASLVFARADRTLDLGAAAVRAEASAAGLVIEEIALTGGEVVLSAEGDAVPSEPSGRASFRLAAESAGVVGWWDPNLASGLEPAGRLELEGTASLTADGVVEAAAEHRGGRLMFAGYEVDDLALRFADETVEVNIAGDPWGSADVAVDRTGFATVAADLRGASVERVLLVAVPEVASRLTGPVTLSGKLVGTVSYPFDLDKLSGDVDIVASSSDGRIELSARGERDRWLVSRARLEAAGATIDAHGETKPETGLQFNGDLQIPDPSVLAERIAAVFPELVLPAVGGGGVDGQFEVTGPQTDPRLECELEWRSPKVEGVAVEAARLQASGGLSEVEFAAVVNDGAAFVAVEGSADPGSLSADGVWKIEADNLERTAALVPGEPAADLDLTGRVTGRGTFTFALGAWSAEGSADLFDTGAGEWRCEHASVFFALDPERLEISKLSAEAYGGTVAGTATLGLDQGFGSTVSGNLEWSGLETGRLPLDLPALAGGSSQGLVKVEGSLERPAGQAELEWRPGAERSKLPAVNIGAALASGVLQMVTEELAAGDGALWIDGVVPLGSLPLPEWLWPDAPEGVAELTVRGKDLRSATLLELFGMEPQAVNATADLDFEAKIDPAKTKDAEIMAELRGLELVHTGGTVRAEGPVVLTVVDRKLELAPAILTGPQTHIRAAGGADLESGEIEGSLKAVLSPGVSRLIPYPVQIHEPIQVATTLAGNIDRPRINLDVDHPGGAIVLRDPPLSIRDLRLEAELVDGRLWINDGRASVNQGSVEIGGGWDPVVGQGMVAELEDVVVFVEGILTQWSGAIAIEPWERGIAKVVGELNLVAGLWDEKVNLAGAFFGSTDLETASDDPLDAISLDLDVRGRGIVRVDNNLGRFDARWDVLRVTGSAARPHLDGEISVSPGGTFNLAGQRVTVRRGSVRFTGNPEVDPSVEIVPESDFAVFGSGEDQVDATSMAAQSLVGGLAGTLGFENETLQPAEISVETERDTADQFMLGQRLSHNIALFFATSTKDVQDRTSMLQLWNMPGLKGLALQGYEKTLTEEYGGNLIQRFQWGGSSLYEDRPTIRKLVLEGEWPLKTRRLKKATGLRKGQPYDPFLPFVARVRMERELAGAGYQEARVRAEAEESGDAWILRFECSPGERRGVVFEGAVPPEDVREEVTALYQHPPLERWSMRNMDSFLDHHFDAEGYPQADISVERQGDDVVVRVDRRGLTELTGPVLNGAPAEAAAAVMKRLGSPSELALMASDSERAALMIEKALGESGYHHAEVLGVESVPTGSESAEIRAEVELGPLSRVAEIVVAGPDPLGLTAPGVFSLKVGDGLDRLAVDQATSQLRAAYDASGYSDAVIRGSAEEGDAGEWTVTVSLEPGIRRTFVGFEVNGLKHTSRKAIESGVTLEEGEVLKNSDLDITAIRIANFAPIERVEVRTVPQGSSGAKVELDVVEKKRWTAEVGGGWSSERGAQARVGVRDDNLFGRGFSLNLRGRWDEVEWLGFVVASMPPLPGKRLSFSSTVGFSRGDAPDDPDFSEDESFWSIEGTRWLGAGERATGHAGEQLTAYYQFTRTRTYEKEPDPDGWLPPIDTTIDVGLLGARYVKDRFDSPFDPTSGYGLLFDIGYSDDFLASDLKYVTALANWSMATKIGSSTWINGLRTGAAEPFDGYFLKKEVRFFAGGQGSIRGFDRNSVGPVTYSDDGWDPAGGGALAILNEELRIPIWGGFRAAVFADIGQVWESWSDADWDFAVGAGVGIRWATPIGPVWADIAWPVVNPDIVPPGEPPYDYPVRPMSSSKPKFYIGIGRPF